MSEVKQPNGHPLLSFAAGNIYLASSGEEDMVLTPDEAIALGYAMFENALYIKAQRKAMADAEAAALRAAEMKAKKEAAQCVPLG